MKDREPGRGRTAAIAGLCVCAALAWQVTMEAQQGQPEPSALRLTLPDAVRLAVDNYPAVQEQRAREQAAGEGVAAARTAYLPRVDLIWQQNRATRNNVFGLLFPQGVVPAVSGPVLPQTGDSVWGSATGALVSWEAIDFGLRRANVALARAQQETASARIAVTELDASAAAADAYLTVLAADAGVGAARANVERLQVFADSVRALVDAQLRPGADQSRTNAELAMSRNQLALAQQASDAARATLAGTIGRPAADVELVQGRLRELPATVLPPAAVAAHPAARAALASVDVVLAREKALDRAALPHILLQSAASARGSGAALADIDTASGLWPRVPNWAAGVSVSFPMTDVFAVRPRRRAEAQNESAERAAYQQAILTLTTQQARAAAAYTAAAAIAQNMPEVLAAAREAELRARTRYASALGTLSEVAEAQRLLAQAEADDAVARLGVWRALLAQAQAAGDLTPFLNQLRIP